MGFSAPTGQTGGKAGEDLRVLGLGQLGTPNQPGLVHLYILSTTRSLYSRRDRNHTSIGPDKSNKKGITRQSIGESAGQFTRAEKGGHRGGDLQLES